MVVIF